MRSFRAGKGIPMVRWEGSRKQDLDLALIQAQIRASVLGQTGTVCGCSHMLRSKPPKKLDQTRPIWVLLGLLQKREKASPFSWQHSSSPNPGPEFSAG